MCAILAVSASQPLSLAERQRLVAARDLMRHRGPDAAGEYYAPAGAATLLHRRLAIIDVDARSDQPFVRDGFAITFNGEIYNYQELDSIVRRAGSVPTTTSDTEIILLLYKHYGPRCLDHLRGMFAFAIYTEVTDELFVARDRVGEKPLLYSISHRGFACASELPALVATGFVEADTETTAANVLYHLPSFRRAPEPFSFRSGVRKLLPATYLRVRAGRIIEERCYWQPPVYTPSPLVTTSAVRDAVVEAIRLTTVADVPVSVLLSGGIDSSIIAAVLTRELGVRTHGYAFGRDAHDPEIIRARAVARELGIPLRECYVHDVDVQRELRDLIDLYGEPIYLLPLAYASVLFRQIRADGMKVALAGNGADELFYGYVSHGRTRAVSHLLHAVGVRDAWMLKRATLLRSIPPAARADTRQALDALYAAWQPLLEPLRRAPYIDFSNWFGLLLENAHSITVSADLAGMQHAVEVRAPFLDYRLIELMMRVPVRQKVSRLFDRSGLFTKQILRDAFRDLLPASVLAQPKMGFGYGIGERHIFGSDDPGRFAQWSYDVWSRSS